MLNPFNTKRHAVEEEQDNSEPFDKRIKQIETIRKNRLMQLEKAKQEAVKALDEAAETINTAQEQAVKEIMYYALIEPIIEKKYLFLDANVTGLTKWSEEIKSVRQKVQDSYTNYYTYIDAYLNQKNVVEDAKKECHAMLIQTEKLALLETLWNENGGL
jgi:hypothetical protein